VLWDESTDSQYLRVYVRQLRQKIEANPDRPQYILTETGVGYLLRPADDVTKSMPPIEA
jgi:two-component system KDP operon response regulator KdpE